LNDVAGLSGAKETVMKRLSVVLISAVLLSACDGGGRPPTAPTAATPAPVPAAPLVTYTLFGTIFEVTPAGRVPVEGVGVYCDGCGSPEGHTQAYTDADGLYSFAWSRNGPTPLLVGKAGYDVVGNANEPIVATVVGDTRFDIELARR
jgi:hypothetical protein